MVYFDDAVEGKVGEWRYWAGTLMRAGGTVSFDNLPIEQLDVCGWVTPETWETHYLGADGSHTVYIDAMRMEYARSSVSNREPVGDLNVREVFVRIRSALP